jgi:RNA polymerase-binding transcription factor DksA
MEKSHMSIESKKCESCGATIPKTRLKALPNTTTCVRCSDVKQRIGLIVSTDDDNHEVQMVDADNTYVQEEIKRHRK